MGVLADEAFDWEWMEDFTESEIKRSSVLYSLPNLVWTTRDGRKIRLYDMKTSHIKNCIKLMEQQDSPEARDIIRLFEAELDTRS